MYEAVNEVEITFLLGSGGPGSIILSPGEVFRLETAGRGDEEWDVLVLSDGEKLDRPNYKDIRRALSSGDLVERFNAVRKVRKTSGLPS